MRSYLCKACGHAEKTLAESDVKCGKCGAPVKLRPPESIERAHSWARDAKTADRHILLAAEAGNFASAAIHRQNMEMRWVYALSCLAEWLGEGMRRLTIDRATWQNWGSKVGRTRLLSEDGRRCCLGFYAQQILGLGDDLIIGVGSPVGAGDLRVTASGRGQQVRDAFSWEAYAGAYDDLITANDNPTNDNPAFGRAAIARDRELREKKIIVLFARHFNVRVTFIGEYPE